jgi:hypothetical protein
MELLFVNGSIIRIICYHTYAKFETGQQQQQKEHKTQQDYTSNQRHGLC